MCLILLAYRYHPLYKVVLAANRDEFYERPTMSAHFWGDHPDLLAGRDLKYGGTWMGIMRTGRFAALTNFREPAPNGRCFRSRGRMVRDFLTTTQPVEEAIRAILLIRDQYSGFNLILGDDRQWFYLSNRTEGVVMLREGIYGLSNHLLDTPWPKVVRSRRALEGVLEDPGPVDADPLLGILADRTPAADGELPDTGFGLEWERILSPPFIVSPTYGTRASTVLLLDHGGGAVLVERSWRSPGGEGETVAHQFALD